jgi:hypothetical protein
VLRNLATRRHRFLKRVWKVTRNGHFWTRLDGFHVRVIPLADEKFKVWIGKRFGRLVYDSLRAAQMRIPGS